MDIRKKYKGVIFDFNGTLLWDTKLHNIAWDMFLRDHRITLTDNQKSEVLHGKTNEEIFRTLFQRTIEEPEQTLLSEEKEQLYRQLCIETNIQLAAGVTELFDFCRLHNIPIAIATSANKPNVDFYIQRFGLLQWFTKERIVYNTGVIESKPHPRIFHLALKELDLPPDDIIAFEDSLAGIRAAMNACIGKIIIVDSNGDGYRFEGCDTIATIYEFNKYYLI